jgi:hypothetical protein
MALDEPHANHFWVGGSFRDRERIDWPNEDYVPPRPRVVTPDNRRRLSDLARRIPAELRPTPEQRTRLTDPDTSLAAAASVMELTTKREAVLTVVRSLTAADPRGATDWMIAEAYRAQEGLPLQSPSGLRTRRSELVEAGLVEDSGQRALLESGRWAVLWRSR